MANQSKVAEVVSPSQYKWGMVVDLDRCTGCGACVTACQAENNIKLNPEDHYLQQRATLWMRIERYWDTNTSGSPRAVYMPVLCQHCNNAPCEPVCPVYAPYHTAEGLNAQIYNRCIGTRLCANNCPYHIRFFNYWPPNVTGTTLENQLNPDVTVRSQGIMEKCTFCIQRINRTERAAMSQNRTVRDGEFAPACAQSCPADVLVFGNLKDPNSRVSRMVNDPRHFQLLEQLGTDPSVVYLKRIYA
jgi:Fe-S-cluster-containing dehydrogenase component